MSSPRSTLVLTTISHAGPTYVLHPDQKLLLGRTQVSDIVLDHGTVTSRHAWIWFEDGQWMVQDAESQSGTFLDEESLGYGVAGPLPFGSRVRLGGVTLQVSEGAPDLQPTVPLGVYPRVAGQAAEKALREVQANKPPPPPPPLFAGRFVLVDKLGRGNQGMVHRAFDQEKKVHVAIKLFDSMDEEQIPRFLQKAAAKATRWGHMFFEHLAWGVDGQTPYLVMELIPGETLRERLSLRPLTMIESVAVARQLAYALGSLHSEDLLHRNIKPDNVRFHEHSPARPLLSDIWVDMQRPHRLLYRRELMDRSLGYLAPEHARTGHANARCDVYSVAAILYRCLAGCMPVPEHDPEGRYGRLGVSDDGPAQPLIEVRPDAPQALCDIVDRALSSDPEDRPEGGIQLFTLLSAVEKSLGLAADTLPLPITRTSEGRRPVLPSRAPVDPFTDRTFQAELRELLVARCKDGLGTGYIHRMTEAVQRAPSTLPTGCGLCGRGYFGQEVVEVRPDLRPIAATHVVELHERYDPPPPLADVRRPFVCQDCLRTDFRRAHEAIQATLAFLSDGDSEPLRPLGPTRRELREGLSALVADARPRFEDKAPCERCSQRWEVLTGPELRLCLSCLDAARAAAAASAVARVSIEEERVRLEYATLYLRARARLAERGRHLPPIVQKDVRLPPKSSIGDWFYTEVTSLERASDPPQAEIDRVGTRLASSIEAHVMASLRGEDAKGTGSRYLTVGTSGLPGYTERYLKCVKPSGPVAERLEMAILVISELLKVGYRYTHQVEDYEWQDATEYYTIFHDLAAKPIGS